MVLWFPLFDFTFPFSLGQNILFGVSVGLGIGLGLGAGMAASRRALPWQGEEQKFVVLFSELVNEIKELRGAVMKLEVCFNKDSCEVILPLKDNKSDEGETDELEEFFEMSEAEPQERFVTFAFRLLSPPKIK